MTISDVIAEYQERYGTKRTLLALTIILERMGNEKGDENGTVHNIGSNTLWKSRSVDKDRRTGNKHSATDF